MRRDRLAVWPPLRGPWSASPASWARARARAKYVLYQRDRVVGGLYDERLLLKDVAAVREAAPDSPLEEPYPGARPLRRLPLPDDEHSAGVLVELLEAAWDQVPPPRRR